MDSSSRSTNLLFELKGRAQALREQARAAGQTLPHCAALDMVAHERGYKDWNAVRAAAKAGLLVVRAEAAQPPWTDIERELPSLAPRLYAPDDLVFPAIKEVMRWARQLDLIAKSSADRAVRRGLLEGLGGQVPYVFEQKPSRYSDDLFHMCGRGYRPFIGIAFTREQLVELGAVAWHEQNGDHNGVTVLSLLDDDIRMSCEPTQLKQLARLLADIAIKAEKLNPDFETMKPRRKNESQSAR